LLAETLSKRLGCEACELRPRKPRTNLDLLLDAFLHRTPPNEPVPFDIGAYDYVILVAPVWNARVAAPMRSFARRFGAHLASYAFITACGGRPGQTERLHRELTRFIGRGPRQLAEIEMQRLLPPAVWRGLRASDYRLKAEDMVKLAPQIERFVEAIGGTQTSHDRDAPNAPAARLESYYKQWSFP
jgi:multimeric flavodoxin WrbA